MSMLKKRKSEDAMDATKLESYDLGSLTAGELSAKVRGGDEILASILAAASVDGADLVQLCRDKGSRSRSSSLTGYADKMSIGWTDSGEDQPSAQVFDAEARRGKDGMIGLLILNDEELQAHSVVVGIDAGSAAERDDVFRLGDVILEVDGVSVHPQFVVDASPPRDLGELMRSSAKQSFSFKVLRSVEMLVSVPPSPTAAAAKQTSTAQTQAQQTTSFKLDLRSNVSAAPLFKPGTPRELLFKHAAALTERHQKLARANRGSIAVSSKDEAAAAAAAHLLSSTPRQAGRSTEDVGFAV